MKIIKSFLSLFMVSFLLSAAIVTIFHTDVPGTVAGVTLFECTFFCLTYFNIVPMPHGILGEYVGAPGVPTESGSAGVQVINSERARGAYMSYRTRPEFEGKDITPSYLRLETQIANGTNKMVFKTYVGDGTTQNPSERRLERNDKFIVTEWGFFLLKQPDGKSNGRLHSYPNPTDFSTAGLADDLESIFNGELSVTVQRKKIFPAYAMQNFLKVPETQQSAGTNRDQRELRKLLVHLTPHLELDGSGTNDIEVTYPAHTGWAGGTAPATFKHYGVLYFNGLLIINGSANT